jgi:prepilin-type N-terminal cleavage/methylation domain-containing protein
MNKKRITLVNKQGFTLFELLVSISIVGILSALAIVSFSSAQKKARDSRRVQDMELVGKAAEQYMLNNSS